MSPLTQFCLWSWRPHFVVDLCPSRKQVLPWWVRCSILFHSSDEIAALPIILDKTITQWNILVGDKLLKKNQRNSRKLCIESSDILKRPKNLKKIPFFLSRHTNVLFTDRCWWQNFCPCDLRLVNTVIHKTQKTRMKVLPFSTVGE